LPTMLNRSKKKFSANCKLYLGDYRPGNDWKYQIKSRGQGD